MEATGVSETANDLFIILTSSLVLPVQPAMLEGFGSCEMLQFLPSLPHLLLLLLSSALKKPDTAFTTLKSIIKRQNYISRLETNGLFSCCPDRLLGGAGGGNRWLLAVVWRDETSGLSAAWQGQENPPGAEVPPRGQRHRGQAGRGAVSC